MVKSEVGLDSGAAVKHDALWGRPTWEGSSFEPGDPCEYTRPACTHDLELAKAGSGSQHQGCVAVPVHTHTPLYVSLSLCLSGSWKK